MNATPQHTPPTPERFFAAVNAYQRTRALEAAIQLEIFTAIGEGSTTTAAIATRCQSSERGVRILCDFLTIQGFLTKDATNYGLAPDSAVFLNRHSPAYLGGTLEFLLAPHLQEANARLADAVRKGGSALGQGTLQPENPDWVKFARAMMPLIHMSAEMVADELQKGGHVTKVLDIAASHGLFGIAVAKRNRTAQIYASDWHNVLEVASQNAKSMGVADRHHLLPGSAFDTDFGAGYDLALVTNFLHHFDAPTNTQFLKKVHAALKPEGRAAIVEFVPNPDRISPPNSAAFSLMMLVTTPSGDAYTFAELETMAKSAGFSRVELSPAEIGLNRLVIAYR